jgi:YggT family protein
MLAACTGSARLVQQLLNLYLIAVFGRVILSWFPVSPGGAMAGIYSFLYTITEPVLGPVRRIMPPLGGLDLSPIVVLFAIQIVSGAIC